MKVRGIWLVAAAAQLLGATACGNSVDGGNGTTSSAPGGSCGDARCDASESPATCPEDCSACGNDWCEVGENASNCPQDCGTCGNGWCGPFENSSNCPQDCPACGNGVCDSGEDATHCGSDCYCGNHTCDSGEDFATCPEDGCACGNGTCESGEDQHGCPADCGAVAVATQTWPGGGYDNTYTCVVLRDGTLRCWGDVGQLLQPNVSALTGVVDVVMAAGFSGYCCDTIAQHAYTVCARRADGDVTCWQARQGCFVDDGGNCTVHDGILADPDWASDVTSMSGGSAICAVEADGSEALGLLVDWEAFVYPGSANVVSCQAVAQPLGDSTQYGCELLADGTALCGGDLGSSSWPDYAPICADVASLAIGQSRACAARLDGSVWCWGEGFGLTPGPVSGLANITSLAAGAGPRTCALEQGGTVWCWGELNETTPVQIGSLANATVVVAGGGRACAVKDDGTVWCWGSLETTATEAPGW